MITGDSFNSSGVAYSTSWTNQQIKNLGRLPNAVFTAGLDINDSGEIAGESILSHGPPFTSRGFTWKAGSGMKNLGTLPGGMSSMANAINSSGIAVGQSDGSSTGGNWSAVMWDASANLKDLGTLAGGTYSIAFGINDSDTVVGYGDTFNGATHAMIWTQARGMRDLNSLIPANSGWELINANAVNKLGQITGYGSIGGHNHGFLLTPSN
jgi:probable HAF family extracellular repeat protein